jgi:hypothetical protein
MMRPFFLLLAAIFCALLLCDRLAIRFPTAVVAAAPAPTSDAHSFSHHDTRSETLQRCLAASQLLEIELSRYRELRAVEVADMDDDVIATFRNSLNKMLQGTWDRLLDEDAYKRWELNHLQDTAEWNREYHDRAMLQRRVKLYRESLCDPRTDAAKARRKQFENHPLEKEARLHEDRVLMFDRDREAALAALK